MREIALGHLHGPRALTEHVEREERAIAILLAAAANGVGDGLAEHELAAEDAHRGLHGLANHRLAHARDHAPEPVPRRFPTHELIRLDDATREHERPGRGVDEHRVRPAEVL